ncbi:glycosyltransferase family 2 protein [Elioraea sp.]|uniref:glycosyltransferase family 2 protein n=1 Tax=Elioraea sp. TaxID=2185103 RepID=UPI0025C1A2E5|nr:glycosyltransferase family 2 protein [Elioraea sp.]
MTDQGTSRAGNGTTGGADPSVTVAVCTRARLHYVARCLDALAAQLPESPPWRLVVVDNDVTGASAARLNELIAPFPDARCVTCATEGISHARNTALAEARKDWIAFLDDDAVPEPGWLAGFAAAYRDAPPGTAAIAGRIDPEYEVPLPAWWPPSMMGMLSIQPVAGRGRIGYDPLPGPVWAIAANLAFAVAPLVAAGGFPDWPSRKGTSLLSGEEAYAARLLEERGHVVWYDDRMRAAHTIQAPRMQPAWLLRRMSGQGATDALMDRAFSGRGTVLRVVLPHAWKALTHSPLALVPGTTPRFIGRRCGLAYSWGYVRAAPAALGLLPAETAR